MGDINSVKFHQTAPKLGLDLIEQIFYSIYRGMTVTDKNPKVDGFIDKAKKWQEEYKQLRAIALDIELTEEFKWGKPCYTLDGNNVFLIHGFKDYCALLFHKGVLIKDPAGMLVAQTENTQATRQLRFTDAEEIEEMAHIIKAYIREAIEVEKSGLQVPYKETEEFDIPEEFQQILDEDPALRDAFEALTPGRQRGYLLYFAGAKQSKTRTARVERYIPLIMEGKGLNDR
jgi:uncharacterized protein YdeI (YjbR/CyaY-like superfamily)